jgi:hypothetical protein
VISGFSSLELPQLTRVLRRTVWGSIIVGAVAILLALLFAPPWATIGIALGLVAALFNLRFLDAGVAKVETRGETNNKVVRRLLGTRTATRLAILTAVVIGLVLVEPSLGIGVAVGLVIFQVNFVASVARALNSAGPQ